MTSLSLAETLNAQGKFTSFEDLAPKVRAFHDLPDPTGDGSSDSSGDGEGEGDTDTDTEGSGAEHAITAGAGGSGAGAENKKDWVAEAKEAGISPMDAARARMEARLDT